MNNTGAPQGELEVWIVLVFRFSSRSSCRVCNSRDEREYIGPKEGVFPSSKQIVKSYG